MSVEPKPPGGWWTAEKYAGLVTASYALSITLWFIVQSQTGGSNDWEVPVELVWFLVLLTSIGVFPCSFVIALALFAALPSEFGRSRSWRAWLAGAIAAILIFSPVGEKLAAILDGWRLRWSPDGSLLPEFLGPLTMLQCMVALALALTWSLPPWRRARLPEGGVADDVLPGGLR